MSPIAWDGSPPSEPRLPILVVKPHWGETLEVRVLGPWEATMLHWCEPKRGLPNGRSLPCMGDECKRDHLEDPPFWYGYAPAQRCSTGLVAAAQQANGHANGSLGELFRKAPDCKMPPPEAAKQLKTWWSNCVCPVTEHMARNVFGTVDPRGLVIQLGRRKGKRELTAEVLERCNAADWPPPFDVRPILLRMWRLRGLKGGA